MHAALKIGVVALALALDVFAVSVGVGMRGLSRSARVRIGVAFAGAEVGMNLIGAGLGAVTGKLIGDAAGYLGFLALVLVGAYMLYESRRSDGREPVNLSAGWGLLIASLSISLDSLGIGFSILYLGVPIAIALAAIAAASIAATMLGLSLGRALGKRVEERAELFAGIVLILTGAAFLVGKALHLG